LIIRWPAAIAPNQVCDAPVSSIDLTPTILDLGGFHVPDHIPGHSMAEWCLKGEGHTNDVLYLGLGDGKPLPEIAIKPGVRKDMKPGQVKRSGIWRAAWDGRYLYFPGSVSGRKGGWLYDHKADPHEMTNLISSSEHLDVKKRLAKAMLKIAQETSDPALPKLHQFLEGKGVL
jgi:arylsulfatase A-like enzyme